jgi:hypothetical protein
MPRDEWLAMDSLVVAGRPWTEDTCPGWYVAQPQVREAAEAAQAGQLVELYFPDPTAPLLDAALELTSSYKRYEADQIREAAKKNR